MKQVIILSLAVFAPFCIGPVTADNLRFESGDSEDESDVRALVDGYLSNRDAFKNCVCRLEIRKSESRDVNAVFLGTASATSVVEGLFVRDRGMERREVIVSDEAIEAARIRRSIDFDPKLQVLKGDRGIYYAMDINGAVLYSPNAPPADAVIGPFSLGRFAAADGDCNVDLIFRKHPNIVSIRVLSQVPNDLPEHAFPATLRGLEYKLNVNGSHVLFQFFLAKEYGNLPIVSRRYVDGQLVSSATITDLRDFDNKRFFPLRCVHVEHLDGNLNEALNSIETRVIKLDVDQPISDEHFKIRFRGNTAVRDLADDQSQIRISEPRLISLEDWDELYKLTAEVSLKRKKLGEDEPQFAVRPSQAVGVTTSRMKYVLFANVIIVSMFVSWWFLRPALSDISAVVK